MRGRRSHPEVLVGPVVTLLAVIGLLAVARVYDRLPVKPPPCQFRQMFSIPCLSCGGTRSFKALAQGQFIEAVKFNPGVILAVLVVIVWFGRGVYRYRKGVIPPAPVESRRRIIRNTIVASCLVFLNWIYLVYFLP